MSSRRYWRDCSFPNEAFVQQAIEAYFASQGFEPVSAGMTDHVCVHPNTGERWSVEAKGHTAAIGLDFRTGLGQLVQRMEEPTTRYAMAVPDTLPFRQQVGGVSSWVREALNLHWLLVAEDGCVMVYAPGDSL